MFLLKRIEKAILNEDFNETYELLEKIDSSQKNNFVYELILLIENNPEVDFGMPGPVIHYIEKFDNYGNYLCESIRRNPNFYLLWMLNRCINDPNERNKKEYIELLRCTASRTDISEEAKKASKQFLEFQTN